MRTVNPISPLHRKPRTEELVNRYNDMCSINTDRLNGKWNSRPDKRKKTTPPSSTAERPNSTADVRLSASATEKNWVQQGCTVPSVQPCPDSCHVETESFFFCDEWRLNHRMERVVRERSLAPVHALRSARRSARLVARPARYKLSPSSSATTRRRCRLPQQVAAPTTDADAASPFRRSGRRRTHHGKRRPPPCTHVDTQSR